MNVHHELHISRKVQPVYVVERRLYNCESQRFARFAQLRDDATGKVGQHCPTRSTIFLLFKEVPPLALPGKTVTGAVQRGI